MSPEALMESLPAPQFKAEIEAGVPVQPDPEQTKLARIAKKNLVPAVALPALEPLTPFLPWEDDGRVPDPGDPGEPPLMVSILREPSKVATLLLDPQGTQRVVLASLGAAMACSLFRAVAVGQAFRLALAWPALELGLAVLLGAAAALGPVYAASLLLSARVPLGRLGAAMLAALAAGSLLLAGMAPPVVLAWRMDPVDLGPYAVLAAFVIVALVTAARLHRLLFELAQQTLAAVKGPTARLTPAETFRVGVVARIAWMMLGLTTVLAFLGVVNG
ncbi:MAG: hypothetical protein JST54_34100 [Deltaproteobacteria bacterium]|nr:hypothetical protein [Deltaproteobacteria bacterium]